MKRLLLFALVAGIALLVLTAPVHAAGSNASAPPFKVDISPLPQAQANQSKIQAALTIVFTIFGAISVLMITIGGFRYITSAGDSQAIARAKATIIFSIVGLLVSITAVAIVTFALGKL